MKINRRNFLGGLFAVSAGVVVAASETVALNRIHWGV